MKSKIIFLMLLLICYSTSQLMGQAFNKANFQHNIENGKVINVSQNTLNSNLTSVLHQIWIPNNWEDESRILYSYNASGLTEKVSYESWSNGSWEKTGEQIFNYNSSDQWIEFTNLYYESDGTVAHGMKWAYSYSGNKMSEGVQYMWDTDNGLWESYSKDIYTYTGELITKTEGYNDMGDGSWELTDETTFTYDGQSREIESLTRTWSEIDNQFTNSDLTTTEYYKDHKMSKWHSRQWDMLNEQWSEENFMLVEYEYDANDNCIEDVFTISQGILGFSFTMIDKAIYSYDVNNFLIGTIDYTWDDTSSEFLPMKKSEITNDSEGQPEVMIHYIYSGGEWVKAEKDIYNYDGSVDVVDENVLPNKLSLAQNYPNPFNPTTTISYTVPKMGNVEVAVYDVLGNYIATLVDEIKSKGEYSVRFDASQLASGSYIYSIKSGNIIIAKKCILIK